MNVVQLSGTLTRDAELRMIGQRKDFPVVTMNVAVENGTSRYNRETQKREVGSGFYRVDVNGDYAQYLLPWLRKGKRVYVIGSLSQYTAGQSGETKTQVMADFVQPLVNMGEVPPPPEPSTEEKAMEEPF